MPINCERSCGRRTPPSPRRHGAAGPRGGSPAKLIVRHSASGRPLPPGPPPPVPTTRPLPTGPPPAAAHRRPPPPPVVANASPRPGAKPPVCSPHSLLASPPPAMLPPPARRRVLTRGPDSTRSLPTASRPRASFFNDNDDDESEDEEIASALLRYRDGAPAKSAFRPVSASDKRAALQAAEGRRTPPPHALVAGRRSAGSYLEAELASRRNASPLPVGFRPIVAELIGSGGRGTPPPRPPSASSRGPLAGGALVARQQQQLLQQRRRNPPPPPPATAPGGAAAAAARPASAPHERPTSAAKSTRLFTGKLHSAGGKVTALATHMHVNAARTIITVLSFNTGTKVPLPAVYLDAERVTAETRFARSRRGAEFDGAPVTDDALVAFVLARLEYHEQSSACDDLYCLRCASDSPCVCLRTLPGDRPGSLECASGAGTAQQPSSTRSLPVRSSSMRVPRPRAPSPAHSEP